MNDPFAMLDPIAKPNGPHVGSSGGAANYATAPMNYGQQPGLGFPPQQQHNANPFGGAPMMSSNAPMQQQQMYYPPQHNGAAFMTQPGPPSFSGLAPAHQQPMGNTTLNPFGFPGQQQQTNPFGPGAFTPMQPQQQMDPFDTQMKTTSMGTTGFLQPQLRPAEPAMRTQPPPAPLTHASSIIMDFDPFSPRDNTPRSPFDVPVPVDQTTNVVDQRKRQTQEAQRSQLGFSSDDFAAGGQGGANKISLKALTISGPAAANAAPASQSDAPFFTETDDFMDQNMFANLDDDDNSGAKKDWGHFAKPKTTNGQKGSNNNSETDDNDEMPRECGPNEFDVTFETGRKLGVLMERVDVWGSNRDDKRQEIAVVKLVVENGAADRVGVTIGSSVVAINKRSVARDSYATVLDMIKAAPRPMTIRFKRGTVNKDTTQGNVLTRISNGTFSVGNLTRGNASWTVKYFAFGGAKMDVLQLFVSRAAYHECVISLYEKRPVHTQIQSFRLCRDHKISPIKSKIYKGYGNLHYFSLTVPSLRFVAAKFASEDYETLKNLWSHTYDAIERKKRMGEEEESEKRCDLPPQAPRLASASGLWLEGSVVLCLVPLFFVSIPARMNHLLQVARRTGKHAVGFKIQLVIHRMNAHLSNFNGAELVAVMTRHKKKAVTKSAPYQTAQKEVVWGDILPFSCTLYMAKTGLFQAKIFQVHVYDTRNDQHVATFEFNLAELVQSDKDTGKETITVATSKCQDARASMAITVISSRVGVGGSRGGANDHHEEASEMSFNGSQSEFSVCTLESRTSAASSHRHPQSKSPTSTGRSGTSDDHSKAHNVRGAHPATANEHGDESEDVDAPSQNQKLKHQELMRTLQDLEAQLRHSESANVHLEKEIDLKELQVQQLQVEKQELAEENEALKRKLSAAEFSAESPSSKSRADSDDGVMQVDFIQYMSLKEEHDKLKLELETLKSAIKTAPTAATTQRESDATQEQEADNKDDDGSSEASSGNDYVDAHDPHLLAENSELKQSVAALSTERDELKDMIATLRDENKQLLAQVKDMQVQTKELIAEIERKNEALALAGPPRASINDMGADSENEDQEQQQEKMIEVKMENEKLVHQLNQLDVVVTKLKSEKSNLLGKLENAESANERARRDIESAQQTIEQLHGEKENLVGKLQDAEDAHDRAQREIESAELTIAQLREQVQEISAQLEATQQDLHTLKHEELAASVAATVAAVAKNQDLEERWDELQRINSELQTRVEELEDKLVQTAAHEEEKEAELQRQVYELKQETEVLREDLERLRVSKQQAEDELLEHTVALKNALETQQRLSIGHEEEVGELTMRNEEMRTRVEQKTEEAQVLTEEWRKKLETLEQENDYFQRELIDSKMKLAELTQQNDELSSQNKKMEKTLLEMKIHAAEKELKEKKK